MIKKLIILFLFISVQANAFFVGGTEEEASVPAVICNNSSKNIIVNIVTKDTTTLSHGDCETIEAQDVQDLVVSEKKSTLVFHPIICTNPGCHLLWFNCLNKPECPKEDMSVEDTSDGELIVRRSIIN